MTGGTGENSAGSWCQRRSIQWARSRITERPSLVAAHERPPIGILLIRCFGCALVECNSEFPAVGFPNNSLYMVTIILFYYKV